MPSPGGSVSGSGRTVSAPAAIQRRRSSFSAAETLALPGGISPESTFCHSRLSFTLPGTMAAPDSPPFCWKRTSRRSRPPCSSDSAPWQSKQCARRIGRISVSKRGAASSARTVAGNRDRQAARRRSQRTADILKGGTRVEGSAVSVWSGLRGRWARATALILPISAVIVEALFLDSKR